jgi:hypothetical protein
MGEGYHPGRASRLFGEKAVRAFAQMPTHAVRQDSATPWMGTEVCVSFDVWATPPPEHGRYSAERTAPVSIGLRGLPVQGSITTGLGSGFLGQE